MGPREMAVVLARKTLNVGLSLVLAVLSNTREQRVRTTRWLYADALDSRAR